MTTIVGRNVKCEVALTFDAAITMEAITKAYPGVATATAHGLSDGEVGYFLSTAGMIELDGQAAMVDSAAANTFAIAGLDTTNYSTLTASGTTFTAAASWGLLGESFGYTVGGGAADQLQDDRLHLSKHVNVAGLNAAEDMTLDVRSPITSGAALDFLIRAARNGTKILMKVTDVASGSVLRVAYGTPSVPGESVQAGALGTGQLSLICPAYVLKPNV